MGLRVGGVYWAVLVAFSGLGAAPPVHAAEKAGPGAVSVRYEVYAAGLPVLGIDLRIAERTGVYTVASSVRSTGVLAVFADFTIASESRGTLAADTPRPLLHETTSHWRHSERRTRLDFAPDGSVAAALTPPEEPGPKVPTPAQTRDSIDPLTAVLAIGHAIARKGTCGGVRMPVFDGRRRYDLVLHDDGIEPASSSGGGGVVRRCAADMVKLAGFSTDGEVHTDHARVWVMQLAPGVPPLPVRVEFHSNWGTVTLRMVRIGFGG